MIASLLPFVLAAFGDDPLLEVASPFLAFEPPPEVQSGRVRWVADYRAAMDEAYVRNVPVMGIVTSADSSGYKTIDRLVYSLPEFAQLSQEVIVLIGLNGTGDACEEREVDGKKVIWSKVFDCPCEDHQRTYELLHSEFVKSAFSNPLQVFLDPIGSELARIDGNTMRFGDLDEKRREAEKKMGTGLSYEAYRAHLIELRELADLRFKRGHRKSLKSLDEKLEIDPDSPLRGLLSFMERMRRELLGEGDRLLAKAGELVEAGDVKGAQKLYSTVSRGFQGYPPADTARAKLKELKRRR